MLTPLNTLRAALVGIALAGTAVTAMPAQAQPNVQFHFGIGGGPGWHAGRPGRHCMSDRDVRQLVRANGYRDIRFLDRRGRIVHQRLGLGIAQDGLGDGGLGGEQADAGQQRDEPRQQLQSTGHCGKTHGARYARASLNPG